MPYPLRHARLQIPVDSVVAAAPAGTIDGRIDMAQDRKTQVLAHMVTLDVVTAAVRAEVAKHVFGNFGDTDDLQDDLHIESDDLTAIALSLEDQLGVRLDRREYRKITNVLALAKALHERLSVKDSPRPT
jgi:acyl carrier protein